MNIKKLNEKIINSFLITARGDFIVETHTKSRMICAREIKIWRFVLSHKHPEIIKVIAQVR